MPANNSLEPCYKFIMFTSYLCGPLGTQQDHTSMSDGFVEDWSLGNSECRALPGATVLLYKECKIERRSTAHTVQKVEEELRNHLL